MDTTPRPAASVPPTPNARGPLPGDKWAVPVVDAAKILPCSLRTLRSLIAADATPYRQIAGRFWMVWPDDFDSFMTAALVVPSSDAGEDAA